MKVPLHSRIAVRFIILVAIISTSARFWAYYLSRSIHLAGLVTTFFGLSAAGADAQTSLFNIPTSDVVERGTLYIEPAFDSGIRRYREGGWQSYGAVVVYGLRENVEIGMNVYLVRTSDGIEPVELQPNVKIQVFDSESKGISVSAGAIAYLPLSRRFRSSSVVSVYAVATKRFTNPSAPRIFAGGYQLINPKRGSGDRRGLLIGIEQPIYKKLSFIADWNSGKNRWGYAAAGFGVPIKKRSYLSGAYYFGNSGRRSDSFGMYFGTNF